MYFRFWSPLAEFEITSVNKRLRIWAIWMCSDMTGLSIMCIHLAVLGQGWRCWVGHCSRGWIFDYYRRLRSSVGRTKGFCRGWLEVWVAGSAGWLMGGDEVSEQLCRLEVQRSWKFKERKKQVLPIPSYSDTSLVGAVLPSFLIFGTLLMYWCFYSDLHLKWRF